MPKLLPLSLCAVALLGAAPSRAAEPALATAVADPHLPWGPCPAFIPAGCEIAVLHGDPAKPNADVYFRVPAGFTIPRHSHSSAERMVLVSGQLEVRYAGQAATTLKPGMYAYGPPRVPHSAVCAAGASCVLFIAFEAPVDATPEAEPAG